MTSPIQTGVRKIRRGEVLEITDLFCGAGGTSTAAYEAAKAAGHPARLIAINHWKVAIATHKANHAAARHFDEDVQSVIPLDVVPSGRLDILIASPVCTDHSNAKGGRPRSEQKRADATMIYRWIDDLYVESLLLENVPEFVNWGPLGADGKVLKSKRGEYFRAFVARLEVIYRVEWKILNCADYGDPTTRKRFFLLAHRPRRHSISWPIPTHASRKIIDRSSQPALFRVHRNDLLPWRSAREHVIDWTIPGTSIFGRKKPLSLNTIRRIVTGLRKYSGIQFVADEYGAALINLKHNSIGRSVEEPSFTQTTRPHQYLAEAMLLNLKGQARRVRSVDEPSFTQCAGGNHQALVTSEFFFNMERGTETGGKGMYGLITARGHIDLEGSQSVDLWTVLEPLLIRWFSQQHGTPLPLSDDIKAKRAEARMAEPYLVRFNGTGGANSIDEPVGALTTKDRWGLVIPQIGAVLDILFRMLHPTELARAMSFPPNYSFAGTRDQKVKQIGNAVPVRTARALIESLLLRPRRLELNKAA